MSFEFDPSLLSHVSVRVDGPFLKSFLSNLENVSFQEAESYLSKIVKGNYAEDEFSIGVRIKPEDYTLNTLLGHLYKNQNYQEISAEVPELESIDLAQEVSDFINSYANISDLAYNVNFLDKKTYKLEKNFDNYIFTELLLHFVNNKTQQYRVDNEYLTVINKDLSSKYIYFNDNKNNLICRFTSKDMQSAYLENLLKQFHMVKLDSEQFFYFSLENNTFSYQEDFNTQVSLASEDLNKLVKAYKTIVLKNLDFNIYEFLEDDLEGVLLNRILKAWQFAYCVSATRTPSVNRIADPLVLKHL